MCIHSCVWLCVCVLLPDALRRPHAYPPSFIESANRADLLFTPATPRKFPQFTKDPFNFIDAQDLCLYHPLDDFGTVERCVSFLCVCCVWCCVVLCLCVCCVWCCVVC